MSTVNIFDEAKEKALSTAEGLLAEQSAKVIDYLVEKHGEGLAAEQIRLETEGVRAGISKFYERLEGKLERAEAEQTQPFRNLISHATEKLSELLDEWLDHQRTAVRRKNAAFPLLEGQDTYKLAYVAVSGLIGRYAEVTIKQGEVYGLQYAINDLGRTVEDEVRFGRIRDNEEAEFYRLVKPNLEKRIGRDYKKTFMSKVEEDRINKGIIDEWEKWSSDQASRVGLVIFDMLSEKLAIFKTELVSRNQSVTSQVYALTLMPEWSAVLLDSSVSQSLLGVMYQPTVIPPKPWRSPIGGGYYLKGTKPTLFIRTNNRQAVNRLKDVHMPEVYDAVNIAQKTAWRVNSKVLEVAQAVYAQKNNKLDAMPQRDPLELPAKPHDIDTNKEALAEWRKAAANVYRLEGARKSKRMAIGTTLSQAAKYRGYDAIYFPHNLDWRGRVNAIPTYNPQGSDLCKGTLIFAEGLPITEEGIKWLAIHGASRAGMDKATLDEAAQWTYDNQGLILNIAENPLDNDYWQTVDEPFCFLAFCFEWAGVVREGADYVCGLPVAFDGSCSGIQHFSAMLRDEVGGAAVNLIPAETMSDLYGIVADHANTLLSEAVKSGTETMLEEYENTATGEVGMRTKYGTKALATAWQEFGLTRNETKRPTMTLPYGSGQFGFTDQVREDTVKPAIDKGMGLMFEGSDNKSHQACQYMAGVLWESLSVKVKSSVEAMAWLQHVASLLSAEVKDRKTGEVLRKRLPIFWTTPDGFPVWHEYRKPKTKSIDAVLYSGKRYQVSGIPTGEYTIDAYKQRSGISPNFVHSMDATHLRKTLVHTRRKYGVQSFHIIHDSFGTLPAHAGGLFKGVREAFVMMYRENDVLEQFRDQFEAQLHETQVDKLKPIPAKGALDIEGVLQSEFCFR